MGAPAKRRRRALVACLAVAAIAYVATCLVLPRGLFINDLGCKLIQTEGLVKTGFGSLAVPWPGQDLDPSFEYGPLPPPYGKVIDGQLHGWTPFAFVVLAAIPYRLFGFAGLYALPLLGALITLLGVAALAGLLPHRRLAQPLAIILAAFCTPIWHYGVSFWEHAPASALVVWGLFFWVRGLLARRWPSLIVAGILCGLAPWLRDELYVLAPALGLVSIMFLGRAWRLVPVFVTGLLIALAPLWALNLAISGSPLGLHAGAAFFSPDGFAGHLAERWSAFRSLLVDAGGSPAVSLLAGFPFVILLALRPEFDERRRGRILAAVGAFALASGFTTLAGNLLSPAPLWRLLSANGFFATSPILIYAAIRAGADPDVSSDGERAARCLWAATVTFMALYVLIVPQGNVPGIHWACRFWLPFYGVLAALAASTITGWFASRWRQPLALALVAALALVSAVDQLHSLRLLAARNTYSERLNRIVASSPIDTVVAVGWFVPQDLAPAFYRKKVLLAGEPQALDGLLSRLAERGIPRALIVSAHRIRFPGAAAPTVVEDGLGFILIEIQAVELRRPGAEP